MASEWINARLEEYIDSCLGKMLDKNKNKGELYPYLGNSNVRWGSFDLDDLAHMKFEKHEHERYGIKYGDLIVCEGGEPGRCAIWEEDLPDMKIQKALHRVRTKDGLDSEFLYYWFLHSGRSGLLDAFFTGTTIKHLTGKALKQLPIKIPPLELQHQVARVLRPLDKKIKLHQQTNQTLEQMAQALFKSWFVDFDPVVDNALAAGSPIPDELARRVEIRKKAHALPDFQPLPEHIRNLFPSEFEQTGESTVGIEGWIPKEWQVSTLGNETDFQNGFAFNSKELSPEEKDGIPIIKMGHIRRGGGFNPEGTKSYLPKDALTDKQAKCFAQKGDLLMAMTDMKSNMAILGNTALVPKSNVYLINQRVGRIRRKQSSHLDYPFLSLLTNHPAVVEELRSRANSGVQVNLTTAAIKETKILVPPKEVHSEFHAAVKSLLERQFANDENASNLRALRDLLLPKLISGEIQLDSSGSSINQEADVQGV